MSIRIPLQGVLDYADTGTSSVATGTIKTFQVTQDTDNVVVKLTASVIGGGVSCYLQTSDDGGTTYYDVGRTSVISNGTQWLSAGTLSAGLGATSTSVIGTTFVNGAIGSATASTVGIKQMTGLPILGIQNRVVLSYSAAGTANDLVRVQVSANNQSATA